MDKSNIMAFRRRKMYMKTLIKDSAPNFGANAVDMTHGLKEYGNGSMQEGINKMCIMARRMGQREGIAATIIAASIVILGYNWIKPKINLLDKKRLNANVLQSELADEQFKHIQQDKEFNWTKVKWGMHIKDYFDIVTFEKWIYPLVCTVYNNRIFLEYPSESEEDIL